VEVLKEEREIALEETINEPTLARELPQYNLSYSFHRLQVDTCTPLHEFFLCYTSCEGNGLLTGGRVDDSALAKRDDVLVFDSAPLEDDIEFCGQPIVKLAHATDRPFADVFVRISEVDQRGKSHNVTKTYKRLDPTRSADVELDIALNYCSHRFVRGKRIRIIIAGGCWPQYTRNHGVENSDNNGCEIHPVEHTVYHNAGRPSMVIFPVVIGSEGEGQQ
jgi:putative CocE/NonD family hydrolase